MIMHCLRNETGSCGPMLVANVFVTCNPVREFVDCCRRIIRRVTFRNYTKRKIFQKRRALIFFLHISIYFLKRCACARYKKTLLSECGVRVFGLEFKCSTCRPSDMCICIHTIVGFVVTIINVIVLIGTWNVCREILASE